MSRLAAINGGKSAADPKIDGGKSAAAPNRLHDYAMIAKPRLSLLVLLTTVVGFYFGSGAHISFQLLLETLFGTALVAMGSGALNQCIERHSDKIMHRTEDRPLPSGRLSYGEVLYFGVAASIAGILYLAIWLNEETAIIASLTLMLYVFVYTPLKRVSSLNTLVGAVPGALPPLIGYAAARGELDWPAYTLFAIIFVWQLPHFLAIAWLYRKEYAEAGLRMLPNDDPDGYSTGMQIFVHALTLLPLSILPAQQFGILGSQRFIQFAGPLYEVGALILGLVFLGSAIGFLIKRNDAAARKVFFSSVIYLPLLLSLMMFDSK
ncbi:MAG TPA: heme o synthase [Planctomycetota bacterium]|nr:heme o synthase [Planctomycetota bacterium]